MLYSVFERFGQWVVHQPTKRGIIVARTTLYVVAAFGVSTLVKETGGLPSFYSHLYYPVVLLAGLTLPLSLALLVAVLAGFGVYPGGALLLDHFNSSQEAFVRPSMLLLVMFMANRLFDRLADARAQVFQFLESMPVAVSVLDAQGRHYYVNHLSQAVTGIGETDTLPDEMATEFQAFVEGTNDPYPAERMPIVRALAGEKAVIDDMVLHRPSGHVNLQVWGAPIHDRRGHVTHAMAVFADITEQRRAQQQIEQLAYHDPLTGLPNRRLMQDRLAQAVARARRQGGHLVVLSLDLDGFKTVNDEYGHEAGDTVLKETARRLLKAVRFTDTVARIGGDEFVVVLPETAPDVAEVVKLRIERALADGFEIEGASVETPASVGMAVWTAHTPDDDSLLIAADRAMYAAKAAHKAPQAEGLRARSASS